MPSLVRARIDRERAGGIAAAAAFGGWDQHVIELAIEEEAPPLPGVVPVQAELVQFLG